MSKKKKVLLLAASLAIICFAAIAIITPLSLKPSLSELAFSESDKSGAEWDAIWLQKSDWLAYVQSVYSGDILDANDILLFKKNDEQLRKRLLSENAFLLLNEHSRSEAFYFVQSDLDQGVGFVIAARLVISLNLLQCFDYIEAGDYEKATAHYRKLLECLQVLCNKSEICMWMRYSVESAQVQKLAYTGLLLETPEKRRWLEDIAIPECINSLSRGTVYWRDSFLKQYALLSKSTDEGVRTIKISSTGESILRKEIELRYRIKSYTFFGEKAPILLDLHWSYVKSLETVFLRGKISDMAVLLNVSPDHLEAELDEVHAALREWIAENPPSPAES